MSAAKTRPSAAEVTEWLSEVPDPEIPAVSITDLGIVREVRWEGDALHVALTPTYSGCPATAVIEMMVETALHGKGLKDVRVERRLSPPWTTDWIGPEARDKLRAYGIAPPIDGTAPDGATGRARRLAGGANRAVPCPRCGSSATREVSRYGSTPCKAAWVCTGCLEPFDHFKCH